MNLKISPNMTKTIKTAAKKLAGTPLLYASKGLAIATTAAVLYDAHVNGKENAIVQDEADTANRVYNQYLQKFTSNSNSATISKMKDVWFEIQQSFPFNHSTSKALGYIGGFSTTVAKNIPAIALSAVSILAKNPKISKTAGCLLGAYGAMVLSSQVISPNVQKQYIA